MLPSTIDSTALCGYDSYELPLRDDAPPTSRGGCTESHNCPATSPFSLKRRRRRVDSCSSSCSTSLTSCGIHLSSLSLSSMSSIDTNHSASIHELDGSDHSSNVNHHRHHHDNDDYHRYQNSTDDDEEDDEDSPALGRLSKRHRAYTNLTKLCGSSSSSLDRLQDSIDACHIMSGGHHHLLLHGNNDDDNEWGFFVDTI